VCIYNKDFQSVYLPYSHLECQYLPDATLLYKCNAPELYTLPEKCFQGDCPCDVQCKGQDTYEEGSMHIVIY